MLFSYAFFWKGFTGLSITIISILTSSPSCRRRARSDGRNEWLGLFARFPPVSPNTPIADFLKCRKTTRRGWVIAQPALQCSPNATYPAVCRPSGRFVHDSSSKARRSLTKQRSSIPQPPALSYAEYGEPSKRRSRTCLRRTLPGEVALFCQTPGSSAPHITPPRSPEAFRHSSTRRIAIVKSATSWKIPAHDFSLRTDRFLKVHAWLDCLSFVTSIPHVLQRLAQPNFAALFASTTAHAPAPVEPTEPNAGGPSLFQRYDRTLRRVSCFRTATSSRTSTNSSDPAPFPSPTTTSCCAFLAALPHLRTQRCPQPNLHLGGNAGTDAAFQRPQSLRPDHEGGRDYGAARSSCNERALPGS